MTLNQIRNLSTKLLSDGECLQNALTTANLTNSLCVEGFVYCMVANGKNVDEYVIRHCWNFKNGNHFDVTKDFVWYKESQNPKEFLYFIVGIYNYADYLKGKNKIEFLSDAAVIAAEINGQLNQA
jgi:hypothetical protein